MIQLLFVGELYGLLHTFNPAAQNTSDKYFDIVEAMESIANAFIISNVNMGL